MPFDKLQSIHTQHKEKLPSELKDRALQTDKDQAAFLNDLLKYKMKICQASGQNEEVEEASAEKFRKQQENIGFFIQEIDEICPFSQIYNHFFFTEERIKILSTKWELGIWTSESRAAAIRCKLIKALLTNFTCGPTEQKAEEESDSSTSAWAPKDSEQFVKLVETIFSGGFDPAEHILNILNDINATPELDQNFKRNIPQILAQKVVKAPKISSSESNIKNESFLNRVWKAKENLTSGPQGADQEEAKNLDQQNPEGLWRFFRKKHGPPLDANILPEVTKSNPQTSTSTSSIPALEIKAEEIKEEKQEKITHDLLPALSTSISKLRKEKRLTQTTLEILFSATEPKKIKRLEDVCLNTNLSMELLQELNQSSAVMSEEQKSTVPGDLGLPFEDYLRLIDPLLMSGCNSEDIEKVLAADEKRGLIKKDSIFLQNFAHWVLQLKEAGRLEQRALKILSSAHDLDEMRVLGTFCKSSLVAVEVLEAISITDAKLAIRQFGWVNQLLECDCKSDSIVSALKAANKREGFFSAEAEFLDAAAFRIAQLQTVEKITPITLSVLFLGNDIAELRKLATLCQFLDQQVLKTLHTAIQKNPQVDPNKMSDYYSLIHGLLSKGLDSRQIAEIFITNKKRVPVERIIIITQEKCREILAETNSASYTAHDFISKHFPIRDQELIPHIFSHLPLPPGVPENKRSDSRRGSISYLGSVEDRTDRSRTQPPPLFPSSPSEVLPEDNEPSVATRVYLGYFMGGALVLGLGALISYTSIEHFDKTQAVKEVFSEHWIEMLVMTGVAIVVAGLGYRAFCEHFGAKEIAEEEPEELLLYDPRNK